MINNKIFKIKFFYNLDYIKTVQKFMKINDIIEGKKIYPNIGADFTKGNNISETVIYIDTRIQSSRMKYWNSNKK